LLTNNFVNDGYAEKPLCAVAAVIHIGDLSMSEQKNNGTIYLFVTIGSPTKRGGHVTRVSTKAEYKGMALARVGDIVTYDDGSEAIIIDGAGFAATWEDKPFALVVSRLDNGDTITETLQDDFGITVRSAKPVPGLFDPAYVLPLTKSVTEEGSAHA
jgi:uncharacterized Zn-binding protein involved in type VI secretion